MRILIVVPTFNERENLPTLVRSLLEYPDYRVLVVDDRSPDGTGAVANALSLESGGRVRCLHRSGPRGLGLSYVDGFAQAVSSDVDFVCQMDADLSHDPAQLPRLLEAADRGDVVIGSRYIPGGRIVNWPLRRKLLSRFANLYVRTVTRLSARDCTSGYRCWHRDALASMPLDQFISDGYSFLVEMLYVATRRGRRVAEVPITFVERRLGTSKLSGGVVLESAITPWKLVGRGS